MAEQPPTIGDQINTKIKATREKLDLLDANTGNVTNEIRDKINEIITLHNQEIGIFSFEIEKLQDEIDQLKNTDQLKDTDKAED